MYVVAIDYGGTNVRAALIDKSCQTHFRVQEKTRPGSKGVFLNQIVGLIRKLKLEEEPLAIVIGVPGRVRKNGLIDELPNVNVTNIDLKSHLRKFFKAPIYIKNDAEIAAFGEAMHGVGKGLPRTYFVTISTGIGGCLVEDGEIKNPSQEIGHTLFPYKGNHYELEKIASGEGVKKLADLNGIKYADAASFFSDVQSLKPFVMPLFDDWLALITQFFNYIQESFNPNVIAVTGGVMNSKHLFWNALVDKLPHINLVETEFGDDSGLIGAGCYGFKKLEK